MRQGIGTLSEKTVHAVMKNYYAPDTDMHEIPIENFVADIYTGQEIIARQITYDKVTKCLVQVRSSQPLVVGAALEAEGKDAGVVTSVAAQLEPPLALAIVKRPFSGAGSQLTVNGINTTVVELA